MYKRNEQIAENCDILIALLESKNFNDIQKIENKYKSKISKIQKRFEKWNKKNNSFSFNFESIKKEKSVCYEIVEDAIKLIVA